MAEQFRVGDIVECVDAAPSERAVARNLWPSPGIREGALYTIAALVSVGLHLEEVSTVRPQDFWAKDRFRLIRRPRAGAFSDLLKVPADLAAESGGAPLSVPALSEAPGGHK